MKNSIYTTDPNRSVPTNGGRVTPTFVNTTNLHRPLDPPRKHRHSRLTPGPCSTNTRSDTVDLWLVAGEQTIKFGSLAIGNTPPQRPQQVLGFRELAALSISTRRRYPKDEGFQFLHEGRIQREVDAEIVPEVLVAILQMMLQSTAEV
jgi:hypothetical protein